MLAKNNVDWVNEDQGNKTEGMPEEKIVIFCQERYEEFEPFLQGCLG